jgi:hypothetical protein
VIPEHFEGKAEGERKPRMSSTRTEIKEKNIHIVRRKELNRNNDFLFSLEKNKCDKCSCSFLFSNKDLSKMYGLKNVFFL